MTTAASAAPEFEIEARGRFDFGQSSRFLETWTPATGTTTGPAVEYAFCSETDWAPLAVSVSGTGDGVGDRDGVRVRTSRPVGAEVRAEIARTFSLDVDAAGFAEVGRRDPLIGALQAQRPGLRPVCFWSTWEAAVWAVLVQRTSMVQAARAKSRMAHELGDAVTLGPDGLDGLDGLDGRELHAFPSPVRLLEQRARVEVPVVKRTWLCGLAEAALEGALDAAHLRSLASEEATAELRQLDGIGPFSAALIAARGAGHPDLFTTSEPRLARRMDEGYGTGPSAAAATAVADGWRPFRSWCSFLVRSATDDELAAARRAARP
jgi:DNA-3-methyladenine glycosylase II